MFMVTDPQTIYEVISVTDDFQSRMVSYKENLFSIIFEIQQADYVSLFQAADE
jgi:uncharacterized membrane protein